MAARTKSAPDPAVVAADGRQLTEALSDLVATKGRPCRMDEFVSYTSATVDDITSALADLFDEGKGDLLLVPDFDESEASPLTSALAAALEDDAVLHPAKATIIPLGHAFAGRDPVHMPECFRDDGTCRCGADQPRPEDECADCGFLRSDHNPLFGQDPPAPGVMATGYENGEVVDRPVAKKATTEQPAFANMPETLAWGTHNGLRVTHGEGKFRGSITLPDRLAEMSNDEEVIFTVRAKYDYDGYRRDPKQEGRTSTLHKNVTLEILTIDLVSGPLPPSA